MAGKLSDNPITMNTLSLLTLAGTAVGSALAGSAVTYWLLNRTVVVLRRHLERSEQARAGAVARSAQAREQIAQLKVAISELRLAHSARPNPATQREQVEQALAEGDEKTLVLPRREGASAFQDTEVMVSRR